MTRMLIKKEHEQYMIESYENGTESTSSLSKLFGYNTGAIYYFLTRNGVKVRKLQQFEGKIEDYVERILNHFDNDNMSIKAISRKYGIAPSTIGRLLKRYGRNIHKHKPNINPIPASTKKEQIISMYQSGMALMIIAKELGYSDHAIRAVLKKSGIEIRSHQIYFCNDNIFEKIDTESKAYFFGILLSDGTLSDKSGCIRLTMTDLDVVEKFKAFIGADNPIREIQPRGTSKLVQYELSIFSHKMTADLIKLGCTPKKTFDITWPTYEVIPKHLIFHFLRGYNDGDGSISSTKQYPHRYMVQLVGTLDFLTGLKNLLDEHSIYSSQLYNRWPERKTSTRQLQICRRDAVNKLLPLMYENATVYMDRKYQKYLDHLAHVAA